MEKAEVICDSDVMIDYLDDHKPRHLVVKQLLEDEIGLDFITLSAITKMELIAGALNKTNLKKLTKNINRFNVLLINQEISSIAIQLVNDYKLSHNLAIPDSLIAATSIHTGLKLLTFNVKDFKFITSLKLYQ